MSNIRIVSRTQRIIVDPATSSVSVINVGSINQATTSLAGKVELATTGEAVTGTDTERAVTPAGLKAAIDALIADAPWGP